jgi:hypothetical protein
LSTGAPGNDGAGMMAGTLKSITQRKKERPVEPTNLIRSSTAAPSPGPAYPNPDPTTRRADTATIDLFSTWPGMTAAS